MGRPRSRASVPGWRASLTGIGLVVAATVVLGAAAFALAAAVATVFD